MSKCVLKRLNTEFLAVDFKRDTATIMVIPKIRIVISAFPWKTDSILDRLSVPNLIIHETIVISHIEITLRILRNPILRIPNLRD